VSVVAGVDFGTLSVRVSLFDKHERRLGCAIAHYPLNRSDRDHTFATLSHSAEMDALIVVTREGLTSCRLNETDLSALAAYKKLYSLHRSAYFSLGLEGAAAQPLGHLLPALRAIAQEQRPQQLL